MISSAGLTDAKPRQTPGSIELDKYIPIGPDDHHAPLDATNHAHYRTLVAQLLYAAVCTRVDIQYTVSRLASYAAAPTKRCLTFLQNLLRYVKGTQSYGLFYPYSSKEASLRGRHLELPASATTTD